MILHYIRIKTLRNNWNVCIRIMVHGWTRLKSGEYLAGLMSQAYVSNVMIRLQTYSIVLLIFLQIREAGSTYYRK